MRHIAGGYKMRKIGFLLFCLLSPFVAVALYWLYGFVMSYLIVTGYFMDSNWHLRDHAAHGDLRSVQREVEAGADVNSKDEYSGATALHRAAQCGAIDIVEFLILKGADVNARTQCGSTPLGFAAAEGHTNIAALLLEKGAELDPKTTGVTPLYVAVQFDHADTAHFLVDQGADLQIRDERGRTLLHCAISNTNVAALFISKGIDVNARDNEGNTPLHSAALWNYKETVALLISKGADMNAKNKEGKTPLDLAEWNESKDAASFLREQGAKRNIRDRR